MPIGGGAASRPVHLDRLLSLALEEDLPFGDVTTDAIVGAESQGLGEFVARSALVLAGAGVAARVFALVDDGSRVEFDARDGDALPAGSRFGRARGALRSLFRAERLALNLLQRMSGVATLTREYVTAVAGTEATIVDTRKTAPGLRALDRLAVRAGGGRNHRSSLSDGVLIKTNHVRVAGSVATAVERARAACPHTLRVEVEVRDLEELREAMAAGADICMLDNMTLAAMAEAVKVNAGSCLLEASGGVRLTTVRAIAETGVDLISVGALTHSAPAADIAFEIAT